MEADAAAPLKSSQSSEKAEEKVRELGNGSSVPSSVM